MSSKEIRLITIILVAIIGLTDTATDIYLPTLPTLAEYFGTSESIISYTLTATFLGYCLAAPLYGPLSDSYGRRNIFFIGLIIFTLGTVISSFSFTVEMLIMSRFMTGIGTSIGYVIGVAVVRDLYSREDYSKVMSLIHMLVAIIPALAPILGGYIGFYFGWQMNFILLTLCGIALLFLTDSMPETRHLDKRSPLNISYLTSNYIKIIKDRKFLGNSIISGFSFSGLWFYYAEIPYILQRFSVPTIYFGYYQASLAVIMVLGSYFNNKTVNVFGMHAVFKFSLSLSFIGSLLFLASSFYMPQSSYMFLLSFSVYAFSLGGIFANTSAYAMDCFNTSPGLVSSALSCIENLIPAISLSIMIHFFNQTPLPVAIAVLISSSLALFVHNLIKDDIKSIANERQSKQSVT